MATMIIVAYYTARCRYCRENQQGRQQQSQSFHLCPPRFLSTYSSIHCYEAWRMPTKTLVSSTLGVVLREANWLRRNIFAAMEKRGEF